MHNKVNERLKKPEFDCAHLSDEYDCGCGDEPVKEKKKEVEDDMDMELGTDDLTGVDMIRGGR